jgi:nitrogen regulatory protein P-II 1
VKRIEAYIQVGKLDAVQAALFGEDVQGLSVSQIRGYGRQLGNTGKGKTNGPVLLPKLKIEVVVSDSKLDIAVQAIIMAAKTGDIGDGKIFISDVQEAIRVRTDERGDAALD